MLPSQTIHQLNMAAHKRKLAVLCFRSKSMTCCGEIRIFIAKTWTETTVQLVHHQLECSNMIDQVLDFYHIGW